jgi:octaheme c-type cytochrome (tetrathionate reductase family)
MDDVESATPAEPEPSASAAPEPPPNGGGRKDWIIGLVAILILIIAPIVIFTGVRQAAEASKADDPWSGVPYRQPHTDHTALMTGPYETGSDVTRACLECHEDAGEEMLHSEHWLWENPPVEVEGHDEPVALGKKNSLNNFCLGIQGNEATCTSCHAGYGWEDDTFDFTDESNIDCLVCHDSSGAYAKDLAGYPAEGSDLLAAAQSVGAPTRDNCGTCHFDGGGGNGVKHGDLDGTLIHPDESLDFHMGELGFECIDCHEATDHEIPGTSTSVKLVDNNPVTCTQCHDAEPHADERLDTHTDRVACETCHIPEYALKDPTKIWWDWSTAGQDDVPEDHFEYLKIKGSFIYETNLTPEYYWFDGTADRYLLGDPMDPDGVTPLNYPNGDINDPHAKISPFKVHRATQPYDTVNEYFLQPKLSGEDGYWVEFDWPLALATGAEITGLEYSGEYDFARSDMYWPLEHMVASADEAVQCTACHAENGLLDWNALGYDGDPMETAGRRSVTESDR